MSSTKQAAVNRGKATNDDDTELFSSSRTVVDQKQNDEPTTANPGLFRAPSSWKRMNWPLQSWSPVRRGHSDGNVTIPRDVATSMSSEVLALPNRQSAGVIKRKRVVDVGQKTVDQMNELARYVNTKGPCAICKTPGTVVTLTQIKKRRRKFMHHWSKHGTETAKRSPQLWSIDASTPPSGHVFKPKSVSWTEHREIEGEIAALHTQREVGLDLLSNDTGAFLLIISVVALVVGVLVIIKATENSVKEYLCLVTPAASMDSVLQMASEDLELEGVQEATEGKQLDGEEDRRGLLEPPVWYGQDRAARKIQRWYRQCQANHREGRDQARKKRTDRWAQSLRAFLTRLQKRWQKRRMDRPSETPADRPLPALTAAPCTTVDCPLSEPSRGPSDTELHTAEGSSDCNSQCWLNGHSQRSDGEEIVQHCSSAQ
ncbi:unnamed protein product [Ixodes pacificus]